MPVDKQSPPLFREDSEEPIDMISIEGEDDSLDKSSSQGGSTVESTPSASFPGVVGNSKNHRSGMPPRRVSASQPVHNSGSLRLRNETKLTLRRRTSSLIRSSDSMDSLVSVKALPKSTSRKASVKRKLEVSDDVHRVRKKLSLPISETSETISPNEPLPGRKSDGQIDYGYYIAKYLNQRHYNDD
ncbi:unnamed protein product [Rhizoctonia solani]|uniref:Uncharacterized protein n=1 Tax=Rhizoctonia solani TaxID=456999 RepID=A0A8H3HEB5_9AGAM|nr:unnamed protein product [Rhizoctonia solani]